MSVLPIGFGSSSGYNIDNSVRLRASASAYLSSTFGTPTDATRGTFVFRVKRGTLSSMMPLFCDGTNGATINFLASNAFEVNANEAGSNKYNDTNKLYRDSSAWYYILVAIDTNLGTAADRLKIYDCDVRLTLSASSNFGSGTSPKLLQAGTKHLGSYKGTQDFFDGLFSDIYFIDGQALTPASFGQTDSNGVWVPKAYTGTYGTNGFHLDFKDAAVTSGSNAGLGKDVSGNGNYWNTTNISVTAGVTYDALTDTPTNNYCTLNPLSTPAIGGTLSEANLKYAGGASYTGSVVRGSIGFPVGQGKWYWETTAVEGGGSQFNGTGICQFDSPVSGSSLTGQWGYEWTSARYRMTNGTETSEAASDLNALDVVCHAYDVATGYLWVRKNSGGWYQGVSGSSGDPAAGTNPSISGIPTTTQMFPYVQLYSRTHQINFGQRPFAYTPPTGFESLCTANLPVVAIPNPKKHFDIVTRAGTAASYSVSGLQFQPDMAWIKSRGRSVDHAIYDAVRGVEKRLESNNSDAEVTGDTTGLTAFNSTGYSGGALDQINGTTATNAFVDWLWKANGAGSSNTDGSITATVSANQTAGFSIVTWTGTGANATVGHGLGVAPKLIFNKPRNATDNWPTYHGSMTALDYVYLNNTNASASLAAMWNSTAPSSTVFSVGTNANINSAAQTMVAYCFAEIPGYSKFGRYTGNGSSDGPFVYCGFRPRYILFKRSDAGAEHWNIFDTARAVYNVTKELIYANLSNAESTSSLLDLVSNGFKARGNDSGFNTSGATYIFAAFAEHPFGGGNVAPAPAR